MGEHRPRLMVPNEEQRGEWEKVGPKVTTNWDLSPLTMVTMSL
jgi:hypothetical protein